MSKEKNGKMDPSEAYLKLLKGEITPEEYVTAIRTDVEGRKSRPATRSATEAAGS